MWFAKQINSGNTNINGVLTEDMELDGIEWTPIGNKNISYKGTFDGANKTVNNLKVTANSSYAGLFGHVMGEVKNMTVNGKIDITTGDIQYIGLIGCMYNGGKASGINSYVDITMADNITSTVFYIGGVAGQLYDGTVSSCAYYGNIDLKSATVDQTGGIVGYVPLQELLVPLRTVPTMVQYPLRTHLIQSEE